jgi:predicted DNA-binding transcriptional regulator AlpA
MIRVYGTRGRSREAAAAHVGVGVTKFDEMVADGRMPEPREIDARVVWDVYELDEHFDRLPRRGAATQPQKGRSDPWAKMAA